MVKEWDQTFVKITNEMIYKKIIDIENHVKKTNGKVKVNKVMASTAITLVLLVIGALLKYGG